MIFPLLSVTFPRWLFPFLSKQRSFSVEGIKLQFLLYNTKMLLFQTAIDESLIIFFELSSLLNFAVHTGSIGGIFQDYTASQFLFSTKRRLEPIACLLIRLANQTIKFSSACQICLRQLIYLQQKKESFSHSLI